MVMVVAGMAESWWLDNKRIENAVTAAEKKERRLMQQEFQDKLTILDRSQKARSLRVNDAICNRYPIPSE
jgi:hypothetical protein